MRSKDDSIFEGTAAKAIEVAYPTLGSARNVLEAKIHERQKLMPNIQGRADSHGKTERIKREILNEKNNRIGCKTSYELRSAASRSRGIPDWFR